ncbi:MAG: MAPEG family protein [Caulobacterales bacterium]
MNVELTMLAYSTALLILLVLIQATAGVLAQGLQPMAGARDALPEPKPFQARTKRVVDNHREGLTMFAPLVLAAALAHVSNNWTVLGAELFFYSRVVHAGLYLAGVPMIRPLVWAVGLVGTLMVLAALLGLLR